MVQSTIITEPPSCASFGASRHLPKKLLIDMSAGVDVVGGAAVVVVAVVVGDVVVTGSAAVVDNAVTVVGKLGNPPEPMLHTWPSKPKMHSAICTVPALEASKHVSLRPLLWICPVPLL